MIKEYLTKGKRSLVYTAIINGKKVIVKEPKPGITAINRIENEAKWLKILNKKGIGPKLIKNSKDSLVIEYIHGIPVIEWTEENNKTKIKEMLKEVFQQCRTLDQLQVDKLEMHNPYKHVIIGKKVRMIDFERCKKTLTPKNVTQFSQFLLKGKYGKLLIEKGFKIDSEELRKNTQEYKKTYAEKDFKKIIGLIK